MKYVKMVIFGSVYLYPILFFLALFVAVRISLTT